MAKHMRNQKGLCLFLVQVFINIHGCVHILPVQTSCLFALSKYLAFPKVYPSQMSRPCKWPHKAKVYNLLFLQCYTERKNNVPGD